jgi:hypothetical protein
MIQRGEVSGDEIAGGIQPAHAGRGRPPDRPVPAVARLIVASCTGVGHEWCGVGLSQQVAPDKLPELSRPAAVAPYSLFFARGK